MPRIFCCYRRDDSAHQAGRIFDHLAAHFGRPELFRDVDSMPLGLDFRRVLSEKVTQCDVLLVFIGDAWLEAADATGQRRLDDPGDFVRIEIESALRRNIPVIPVLVGLAELPKEVDLPEGLRELAFRHGLPVRRDPDFHHDLERLICGIEEVTGAPPAASAHPGSQPVVAHPRAPTPPQPGSASAPEKPLPPGTPPAPREQRRPVGQRLRALLCHVGPWHLAGVAVAAMLLADVCILRAVLPSAPPPASPREEQGRWVDPSWDEQPHGVRWLTWRKAVHEKLSAASVTEETLAEALRIKRPTARTSIPAQVLRHDQAVADVLLSYPGVQAILKMRFGIDERFLGTGLSSPVNTTDYGAASVHEYLIENLRVSEPSVWMRKVDPPLNPEMTIKELIQEGKEQDDPKRELKRVIEAYAEAKQTGKAVIRFALLDASKGPYNTLGHPDRHRVFASDLAEVWNRKVKEAADLSGFRSSGGKTLFVWVFVPPSDNDVVPATWAQVLDHLPEWLESAQKRSP